MALQLACYAFACLGEAGLSSATDNADERLPTLGRNRCSKIAFVLRKQH